MSARRVKLSEVVSINPKTDASTFDLQDEVAFIAMADVSEQGQVANIQVRVFDEVKKGYTYFQNGDVLLAKITPCFENGKATQVTGLFSEIGFGSTEFHVLRPSKQINGRFLFHLVWNINFRRLGELRMTGSAGQKRVPAKFLEEYEINLPSLEEQKRIAAILDKADSLRRKRAQAIALADDFLRATFLDMFGDPVTNPKGWPVNTLNELCERIQIGPFGTQLHQEDYVSGGIPLINPTHIVKGKICPDNDLTVTPEKYAELTEYHMKPGDIVLGRRGEMGRCAHVTDSEDGYLCGTGSLFLRVKKEKILPVFLEGVISSKSAKSEFERASLGATMPNLNKSIVGDFKIGLPPIELQKQFLQIVHKTLLQLDLQKNNSKELEFLSASLMYQLG